MIEITLFNNGVDIHGHSNPVTCAEVSMLTWATANSLGKADLTSKYYASGVLGSDEGHSCFTLDTKNEKAMYLFNEYKQNLKICVEHLWKPGTVQVKIVEHSFIYPFPKEIEEYMYL